MRRAYFCHDNETCFVATNTIKMILVAAPANDNEHLLVQHLLVRQPVTGELNLIMQRFVMTPGETTPSFGRKKTVTECQLCTQSCLRCRSGI